MKIKLIFIVAVLHFLSCSNLKTHSNYKKYNLINNKLTNKLDSIYKEKSIPGFSVAIVNEEGIIYTKGFGKTSLSKKEKYEANTSQKIASISKTVLGIALLKAQEMKKLNINDPINKYLPYKVINPYYPETPILIKHLAYHNSSLRDTRDIFENSYIIINEEVKTNEQALPFFKKSNAEISLEQFLTNSLFKEGKWYGEDSFFDFEPDKERRYSNLGAGICQYILEKVTEKSYEAFTKETIFEPLKMQNISWEYSSSVKNRTKLFLNDTTLITPYKGFNKADGELRTSVNDLSILLIEFIKAYNGKGTLLNKESYQLLFDAKQFPNQRSQFGIFIEFRPIAFGFKENLIGHMGADPGLLTAMYFNPESGLGKIMFINIEPRTKKIRDQINKIWKALLAHENKIKNVAKAL